MSNVLLAVEYLEIQNEGYGLYLLRNTPIRIHTHKLYTVSYTYRYIISKLELVLRLLPAKSLIVFHEHQTQIMRSREDSWGGGGGVGGCREGS